nr:hypothetical protein MACL_00003267 [Theileria orientalis]
MERNRNIKEYKAERE